MKTPPPRARAFTLVELILVVAVLGLLAALVVRAQEDAQQRSERMQCMSNLKEIGLAFRVWANRHGNRLPMQYDADRGGSREAIESGEPWRHFQAISNQLKTPRMLICPTDDRERARDFSRLTVANLSYFVGLDVDERQPQMLMSGDRNLTNGVAPKKGILELTDAPLAGWTDVMHVESGNVGLADGSARHLSTVGLRRQITAANQTSKAGTTRLQLPVAPKP